MSCSATSLDRKIRDLFYFLFLNLEKHWIETRRPKQGVACGVELHRAQVVARSVVLLVRAVRGALRERQLGMGGGVRRRVLVGLALAMFLGIAIYFRLWTIDYSISSKDTEVLRFPPFFLFPFPFLFLLRFRSVIDRGFCLAAQIW